MSKERLYQVLKAPLVSEKSTRIQGEGNQYAFQVAQDATKGEIKAAVEMLFEVKVKNVNVTNVKGKTKMFRFKAGRRPSWKKAYVRIADGQTIDVFSAANAIAE